MSMEHSNQYYLKMYAPSAMTKLYIPRHGTMLVYTICMRADN